MQRFGIDVSHWQGDFNFEKAKAQGVEFVILKAGGGDGGLYMDKKFETFYAQAKAIGMPVGAYFFGGATSVAEAVKEAEKFISILDGKQFEYPVYYDVEGKMISQSKALLTDEIIAFCECMEKAGYYAGIYSSESFYNSNMEDSRLSSYAHWVAKYSSNAPVLKSGIKYGIWQFGGEKNFIRSNRIAGVVCDQDYCYVDYPKAIKRAGLNGYTAEGTPEKQPSTPAEQLPDPETKPTIPEEDQQTAAPVYEVGKTYTTQVELKVRRGPGTKYAALKHSELTTNAQQNDTDKDGAIEKGTKVTCLEVAASGNDIWIRIPSGWIAAYYRKKVYVS